MIEPESPLRWHLMSTTLFKKPKWVFERRNHQVWKSEISSSNRRHPIATMKENLGVCVNIKQRVARWRWMILIVKHVLWGGKVSIEKDEKKILKYSEQARIDCHSTHWIAITRCLRRKIREWLKLNEPNGHDNSQIMREALEERVADIARFSRGPLVVSNNKLGRNEKLKKLGGRRNFPRRSVFNWDRAIDWHKKGKSKVNLHKKLSSLKWMELQQL